MSEGKRWMIAYKGGKGGLVRARRTSSLAISSACEFQKHTPIMIHVKTRLAQRRLGREYKGKCRTREVRTHSHGLPAFKRFKFRGWRATPEPSHVHCIIRSY